MNDVLTFRAELYQWLVLTGAMIVVVSALAKLWQWVQRRGKRLHVRDVFFCETGNRPDLQRLGDIQMQVRFRVYNDTHKDISIYYPRIRFMRGRQRLVDLPLDNIDVEVEVPSEKSVYVGFCWLRKDLPPVGRTPRTGTPREEDYRMIFEQADSCYLVADDGKGKESHRFYLQAFDPANFPSLRKFLGYDKAAESEVKTGSL